MIRSMLVTSILVLCAAPSLATQVEINPPEGWDSSYLTAETYTQATGIVGDTFYPGDLGVWNFESGDLVNYSWMDAALSNSGLVFDFTLGIDNVLPSQATSDIEIWFMVHEDVEYELSGTFEAFDPVGRAVLMSSSLYELIPASPYFEGSFVSLYDSLHWSESTPNEMFTLGQAGGDTLDIENGSLTGTLIAFRVYRLIWFSGIGVTGSGPANPTTSYSHLELLFNPEPPPLPMTSGIGRLTIAILCALFGLKIREWSFQ